VPESAFGVRLAPWAGVGFALLMGASLVVINDAPGARSSDDAITSYYASSRFWPLEITVLYLLPLSGVCFLWFLGVLRYRLGLLEGSKVGLIATVQYGSGIIFLALLVATSLSLAFVLVFPAWVLVVSIQQLVRRHTGATEITGVPVIRLPCGVFGI
jgi:hypothetical protein